MPFYTQVAVINQSTIVTDIEGANMISALNSLLPMFCSSWSIASVNTVYVAKGSITVPKTAYQVYLLDTTDLSGALAYHSLTYNDVPYAKVFANTVLSRGGVIMYEPTLLLSTVAQTLSHEVFELLIDPRCNIWWMNSNTGELFAGEVVDPVQNNVVVVNLSSGVKVGMSDWILPGWQDTLNTDGPFNYLNTLTAPFEVKNGYAMIIKNNNISFIYGDKGKSMTNSHSQISSRMVRRLSSVAKMSSN